VLLSIEHPTDSWDREIAKLVKRFRISDKILWNIRIQCYARTQCWDDLYKLALEKTSPVGYKPFALTCIK
jgi:hypothetical protein